MRRFISLGGRGLESEMCGVVRGFLRTRHVSHLPSTLPQAAPQGKTALGWSGGAIVKGRKGVSGEVWCGRVCMRARLVSHLRRSEFSLRVFPTASAVG